MHYLTHTVELNVKLPRTETPSYIHNCLLGWMIFIHGIIINHQDNKDWERKLYSHTVLKTIKHTIKLRLISTVVHPQTFYSFWKSHLRVLVASIVAGWVECVMPPKQRKPDNMWKIALSLPPVSETSWQDSNFKWAGWYKVNNRFSKTAEANRTQLEKLSSCYCTVLYWIVHLASNHGNRAVNIDVVTTM